jgi:hypothetical protein
MFVWKRRGDLFVGSLIIPFKTNYCICHRKTKHLHKYILKFTIYKNYSACLPPPHACIDYTTNWSVLVLQGKGLKAAGRATVESDGSVKPKVPRISNSTENCGKWKKIIGLLRFVNFTVKTQNNDIGPVAIWFLFWMLTNHRITVGFFLLDWCSSGSTWQKHHHSWWHIVNLWN